MIHSYGHSWYSIHGFSGKTVTWCPSDSEDRFNANMADRKQRARLEEFGWTRDNVSYTFNTDGFRSDEFTYEPSDSVVFLGCSLTMGTGVDLQSSWAYQVASSLGLRRYNLGVGGGSADMCFRLAHHWIPRLRPKYVMMLTPRTGRMEIVMEKNIIPCIPNMTYLPDDVMARISDYYNAWLSYPANAEMNQLKNVMGVQMICNNLGIPIIEIPLDTTVFIENETLTQSFCEGRDLMHPGKRWNDAVAKTFLDRM